MHIVIDGRIINSSTGRYVERLVTYLEKIDTVNHYTILVPAKDLNFWKPSNENFSVIPADFPNYSFSEQVGLRRLLDELRPDLVHFCMPQQPILYSGKTVTTIHDLTLLKTWNTDKNWLVFHIKQLVGRYVFHHVIKHSTYILTDSYFSKKEIEQYDTRAIDKTIVTYLAADKTELPLVPYVLPFPKFILYVGAFSNYKNIRRLGDAHHQLKKLYPDLGLVLVGRKNSLAQQTEQYFSSKNYSNILFTDFISDESRDWLFTKADAYVFPSLMEGFGLPPLEAMAYGTPVISSNASCMPEILGDAAEYFNPKDVDDIAHAIDRVLSDPALRKEMTKKGLDQVKKYSWQRTAQQTHAIYMKALES